MQLLDRSHLAEARAPPYAPSGVGYEVVAAHKHSDTLLKGVE